MNGNGRSAPAWGLVASLSVVFLPACRGSDAKEADARVTKQSELVVFVYDRSTSIPDYQLELARELTRERIGLLDHGDRIAGLQVLERSLDEPPQRWSQNIPDRQWEGKRIARDSVSLSRFLRDAEVYLRAFSDPAGRDGIMGTDLLSTFHDLSAELRPYRDRRTVAYVFSDLLQSSETIEMEGARRMPSDGWVAAHAESGRLPDLEGLCVVVIGARVDTEAGQRVKSFWSEYFGATGAVLLDHNYGLRPVSLPVAPCA